MTRPFFQLALDLALAPRHGREDFLVSTSNEAAYDAIELWPRWPDPVLILVGPEGAGKSHLGAIWATRTGARKLAAGALANADLPELVSGRALLIDDADRAGGDETALFHLLNLVRESGGFLLLTARRRPDFWGLATADLVSRLRLGPCVAIEAPDEALIRAVLVKLFADQQLGIDAGVVDYVARRIERSLAAARAVVAALDRVSLARGQRITRAMAGEVLQSLFELPEDAASR